MKRLTTILPILFLIVTAGCGGLVERAEKAHWTAFMTTDTFLRLERNLDDAGMRDPQMHQAAEEIRETAPPVFMDAFDIIQEYKAERTPEGRFALEGSMELLKSITAKSQKYLP